MESNNPAPPPAAAKQPTSGLAIVSLVTSLLCLGPVAIICGHISLSRIKRAGGSLGGRGLAIAGLAIGYVTLVSYLGVIPAVFVASRAWVKASDRAVCLMVQRNIDSAVGAYQDFNSLAPGAPLDIKEVLDSMATPHSLTCPLGGTYEFSATFPQDGQSVVTCSNPDHSATAPRN